MPLKDGWRHVGNPEYVNSPHTSLKSVIDNGPSIYPAFNDDGDSSQTLRKLSMGSSHGYPSFHSDIGRSKDSPQSVAAYPRELSGSPHTLRKTLVDRGSPTYSTFPVDARRDNSWSGSRGELDRDQPHVYVNTSDVDGSRNAFQPYSPRRALRTVRFHQDSSTKPQASLSSTTLRTLSGSKSREPRFQPQAQSARPRCNPASSLRDYGHKDSGRAATGSPVGSVWPMDDGACRYGELTDYGSGREGTGDSANDGGDTADEGTTTTSGSYTLDHEDEMQDAQCDIFV